MRGNKQEQICIIQSNRAGRSVARIKKALGRVNIIHATSGAEHDEREIALIRSLGSDLIREARHEQEWLDELRQERRERMQLECDFRRSRRG